LPIVKDVFEGEIERIVHHSIKTVMSVVRNIANVSIEYFTNLIDASCSSVLFPEIFSDLRDSVNSDSIKVELFNNSVHPFQESLTDKRIILIKIRKSSKSANLYFMLIIPIVNNTILILLSILCGILMLIVISYLYFIMNKLESPSCEYNYFDMIGLKATVYVSIKKDKPGMIHVFYNGLTREINAITLSDKIYNVNDEVTIVNMISEDKCVIN
jgi:hypothetical protein